MNRPVNRTAKTLNPPVILLAMIVSISGCSISSDEQQATANIAEGPTDMTEGPTDMTEDPSGMTEDPTVIGMAGVDQEGLIEISSWLQMNVIRYDLNGDGLPDEALSQDKINAYREQIGDPDCPTDGCRGYRLISDLDFDTDGSGSFDAADSLYNGGAGWEPIGNCGANGDCSDDDDAEDDQPFNAIFKGDGRTISNLHIDRQDRETVGLFGLIGSRARIIGLALTEVNVSGGDNSGALVGRIEDGEVENSYTTGSVRGDEDVGGLAGDNRDGYIANSYSESSVSGYSSVGGLVGKNNEGTIDQSHYKQGAVTGFRRVGGLVGENEEGFISNQSYALGTVAFDDEADPKMDEEGDEEDAESFGGLVGIHENPGRIESSYSRAVISIPDEDDIENIENVDDVGGLVGTNEGLIYSSYASGAVAGNDDRVGGLVGRNEASGQIENCYASGATTGSDSDIGGLVGDNRGALLNSYAAGSVSGNERVGGLVGNNEGSIENSYATGSVSGDEDIGGLVGKNEEGDDETAEGSIAASYWDSEASGVSNGVGDNDGEGSATSQTSAEMKMLDSSGSGWLENNWDFGDNSQYPALRAREAQGAIQEVLADQPCPRVDCL